MSQGITVVGAGSWGTVVAKLLADRDHTVKLHCYPASIADGINRHRRNPLFFPQVDLPAGIHATADIASALEGTGTVYLVVPTRYLKKFMLAAVDTWRQWAQPGCVLCNCTKGLLLDPTERTDAWLKQLLPAVDLCHLAGPNFARELIAGLPTATVVAGPQHAAQQVQSQMMSDTLRVYTGTDTVGVEVSGFYKNVIAIAAGACTELGLGNNARATLITRALAEMGRLVNFFGGSAGTLIGLAGVGDLLLTCSSELSRNFQVGIRRARGQRLDQILAEMTEVAEGIQAAEALHRWPQEHGLDDWPELPIAAEVYRFVHENTDPRSALGNLMSRPPKAE